MATAKRHPWRTYKDRSEIKDDPVSQYNFLVHEVLKVGKLWVDTKAKDIDLAKALSDLVQWEEAHPRLNKG